MDVGGVPVNGGDGSVCERLSVRRLAFDVLRARNGYDSEDYDDDAFQILLNDDTVLGYRAVMKVLRKKERQLRKAVEALDARRAS